MVFGHELSTGSRTGVVNGADQLAAVSHEDGGWRERQSGRAGWQRRRKRRLRIAREKVPASGAAVVNQVFVVTLTDGADTAGVVLGIPTIKQREPKTWLLATTGNR